LDSSGTIKNPSKESQSGGDKFKWSTSRAQDDWLARLLYH